MTKTQYKNDFNGKYYERISLSVPKGFKDIIKGLASDKGMSVNGYLIHLVQKDQEGMFDTMQIAEKNKEQILSINGNMHDGYDIMFKDGHKCHQRTKKDVRNYIISYLAQDSKSLAQDT